MNKDNYAVLMAGGVGSRFWPVSTTQKPKQFRDLLGTGETLIQTTFRRLTALVPAENILILTNEKYEILVHDQLNVEPGQVVLEPAMRNTAPAVLLAALKIYKKNKNAVMIMAPSDHWIENETAFTNDINAAFEACRRDDRIVTLGVLPSFPNTGYGYIQYDKNGSGKVKNVNEFTEKPTIEVARRFLKEGNYLWNAGIFIWNVDFILRSFSRNLPELYDLFDKGREKLNTVEEFDFIGKHYPSAPDISIDYGILEKEKNIFVIPASFDWNDLGTWGSLFDQCDKDGQENVVLNARVLAQASEGNIISSNSNKVVVIDGLHRYIVVDEKDVLLIVPKEKEQEIKQIREMVQKKFGENLG